MAREEAEIMIRLGNIENMNQELSKKIKGRTIEAIKGKRRPVKKKLVLDIFVLPQRLTRIQVQAPQAVLLILRAHDFHAHTESGTPPAVDPHDYNLNKDTIIYISQRRISMS